MSTPQTILAIDMGTQSVRALAFDVHGHLLDSAQIRFDPVYHSPQPGWAEQDPELYWAGVGDACQALWKGGVVKPEAIAGVAMTFQRSTFVCTDADGKALRPAILWLDQRRASKYRRLPFFLRLLVKLAGSEASIDAIIAGAPANWIRQHEPELWRKTKHYLLLSGYISHRMTGALRDSVACQVGPQPFDYKRHTWAAPSEWSWKSFGVDRARLPELVSPGQRLGEILASAAAHTGLAEGLPVIAGGSDKACEVLGSGCLSVDQGCVGLGTTATFNVDAAHYVEPVRLVPPYPSAQPGRFNLEYQVFRGFWMITWFKEQFAQLEVQRAEEEGVSAEDLLEALATEVPAGSLGLMLQPFWSPGVQYPSIEAKGAMIGFGGVHHKPHMYRALIEGMAYALRDGRDRTVRRTGIPLRRLAVCGGGSQSDLVMQVMADVFGMPATRPALYEASGLGAAILGSVGLGLHPDITTAVREMTRDGEVFEPIPANVALYDRLYREVYSKLYARLKPLYQSIMDITGYPAMPGSED